MERWIHVDLKAMAPRSNNLIRDIGAWAKEGATGVVFEWENMFPYPGFESAVRRDAYTPEEIGRILDACRENGLHAIPLVQTFGHVEWFLSNESFACLREFPEDPTHIRACDGGSWAVVKSWIAALLEAHHDSPYIHLGADETQRISEIDRPDCSSKREGAAAVYARHMQPLFEQVIAAGKRPIIWADMPLSHPEALDDFPKELIFCDWLYQQTTEYGETVKAWGLTPRWVNGGNYDQFSDEVKGRYEKYWRMDSDDFPTKLYQCPYLPYLRDQGFDVIAAPGTLFSGNSFSAPDLPRHRANQRVWLNAARRFGALGALDTCWAVRGALRETTRAGHRGFLFQAREEGEIPEDREIALRVWWPAARRSAEQVAEAVDGLRPCVDTFSQTLPMNFDPDTKSHRPITFEERWDLVSGGPSELPDNDMSGDLAELPDDDPAVEERLTAGERAAKAIDALRPLLDSSEEAEAWTLGAREVELRANLWLALRSAARGEQTQTRLTDLAVALKMQGNAVCDFMEERYRPADVRLTRESRYDGALRLLKKLGA